MPAVAFVPIAAELLLPAAITEAIGAGVGGALGAVGIDAAATIAGTVTVGEAVTGAVIGAGSNALSAAITGSDIGSAALSGGIGGAVSPIVGGALGQALTPSLGDTAAGRVLTGALTKGVGREVGAIAGGSATGRDIGQTARGALPGALASGLFAGGKEYLAQQGVDPSTDIGKAVSSLGQTNLTKILAGQPLFGGTVSQATGAPYTPPPSQPMYQPAGATPVASATPSPGFGGGPGAPVFGTEQQTAPTGKWGQKSLRGTDTDQTAQLGGAVG